METILIIDNYDSFTYNIVQYVKERGKYEVDVFRNDEIDLDEIEKYKRIILSPGPGVPKEAGILKALVKKYAPSKKIFGICLGMQAIGEVFGAELKNLENVFHGISTPINVLNSSDQLYLKLPVTINVGRYHSWVISNKSVPKQLEVTAIDENNQIMSIKHREYDVYGVQYHPESLLTDHGRTIINNFLTI